MRLLEEADLERLGAFLGQHLSGSMFLLSNLRAAGVVNRGQPYGAHYAGAFEGEALRGVVAHVNNGNLLFQAPAHAAALAREAGRLSGRAVRGLVGPWDQVSAARAALGLTGAAASLDECEDLFALSLDALVEPPSLHGREVRRAIPAEAPLLARWRHDYRLEALHEPARPELLEECAEEMRGSIEAGKLFVLLEGETPLATTAFNAQLPRCVQVGGVWTPPASRRRGLARAVVAGSLRIARAEGATDALLFTAQHNLPARTAYLALGFRKVGSYGLVIFREEHRVR